MKIQKAVVYYVFKDEDQYTWHNATNWTVVMGESDEQIHDFEDLEAEFQRELANLETK